ncbi:MAG: 2OG-Fe(II) oxygenase [Burkholderiaceae bacterium]|nr:MAG: 2OG-Fe(II) oxygenase [Burkholderiaceae bacterium]TAM07153.1 MAG: 2OG-Fe(II) oxygenase [Pusillimonas sp.]
MSRYDEIYQSLEKQGWAISDSVIPMSWQITLLMQGWQLWEDGHFHMAGIGRGANDARRPDIRGDTIYWIQPKSPEARHPFFAWMAEFREDLSKRYHLGLRSQEFHFARYGAGQGYKKHIDQHRDSDHRKISIVLYLNVQWNPINGGELCLYEPENPDLETRRVTPMGARLVVFRSGLIPHAVLPCRQTRWSLTGWLRSDEIPE